MTTAARSLVSPLLLARGFGQGTDFDIYTRAAQADESSDRPIIRMVGSSTVKDLQGDTMMVTALEDMTKCDSNLTIFIDHTYDLPDSVYGSLMEAPAIKMQGGIADLHLAVETDFSRPVSKARDIYTQISKGKIRMGCSIGCQVTNYSLEEGADHDSWFPPLIIHNVYTVEFSVVGIPANQRSWVEQAVKGLFERSLAEGRVEDTMKLAPAMKSLFSRDYQSTLGYLESDGLRKDLEQVRERGAAPRRIVFDFKSDAFCLEERKGVKKSLTREETSTLLEKATPPVTPEPVTEPEEVDEEVLDITKTASGKTSWPLMDIGTEWTGSKAEKDIFAYAKGDDGEIAASKAKQGFLWYDPDNSDKQSGYKMPFCYSGDGGLKIVPLGVRACANVLSGGRGGGDFSGDDGAMKSKVKTLYGRINSQFNPDPKWEVPWEKGEKGYDISSDYPYVLDGDHELVERGWHTHAHKNFSSSAPLTHWHEGNATHSLKSLIDIEGLTLTGVPSDVRDLETETTKEIADSESSEALNRQDLGEVTVKADGSHEAFTGTHSHAHSANDSQGGDETHSHSHSHDGDANHSHSHAEEKSEEPEVQKAIEPEQHLEVQELPLQEVELIEEVKQGEVIVPSPEQVALLGVYNSIGKQLGFPDHALTTKCDLVATEGDAGIVRATLSALDDCSDAMIELATKTDGYVDALMAMMGVPDTNDEDGSSEDGYTEAGETAVASSPLNPFPGMASHTPGTRKEGRELSGSNKQKLQAIHDTVAAMHPDACPVGDGTAHQGGNTTVEEAQEEARQMGQGDAYTNLSSLFGDTLRTALFKSLEDINAKTLVEGTVSKAVDEAMNDARANLELLQREQMVLMQHLSKLSNMPLGRPTTLQRKVTPVSQHSIDNTVDYEEMLQVAGIETPKGTLQEALAQTSIIEVPIVRAGQEIRTKYRRWPVGVGGAVGEGIRPPLTADQKTLMHYMDWSTYTNASGTVDVPLVDDPAERV